MVTGILCIKIFNNNFHQYALKNIFSELLSNWNILLTNMCISKGRWSKVHQKLQENIFSNLQKFTKKCDCWLQEWLQIHALEFFYISIFKV